MKKLLFYINTLGFGGAERVISNLANQFSMDNFQVYLVLSFPRDREYLINKSVNKYYLEKEEIIDNFVKRNISRTKRLRELIKELMPDVVVSFMAEPNFRAIVASLGLKIPVIISVRNDPNKEYAGKKYYYAQKFLFPFANGYVFQTEDAKNWFPKKIQRKSTIILNQVAPDFFNMEKKSEDYYVAVGRLTKQKNYSMMIKGFQKFLSQHPQEQLYIYGEGEDRQMFQKMIDDYSLEKNIHLMGRTENVPEILSHAKAFVMTSNYEGMPNAMLEAMAVGVPVIVTDCPCGGSRMIISHQKNGFLIPTNDVDALCSALNRLNEDADLRNFIARESKKTAEHFRPAAVYQQWKDYILKVCGDE